MKKLSIIIIALLLCVSLLAACSDKTNEGLEAASTYLHNLYKDAAEVTAADYEVVGKIIIDGVTYTVTWTVDSDKIRVEDLGNGFVKIDVEEESLEEVSYKLTATIADEKGNTTTREYTRKVPKFDITDWDEYMAAKEGDTLVVQGTVVAINSKAAGNTRNHLFLVDATGKGGYYSYQMEADPVADLGIKVGMTVRVTGPAAPYNGMMEIKGGTATIISEEIKEITPIDITDKFVEGADFNQFVALPVVIKGVAIGGQELEVANSQYLFFEINGVKSYVRTYVTDFPTNLKAEDKATIDADHAAHFGYKADVTGLLVTYSGTPYLIPLSTTPFTNYQEVQKTPAEKVDAELEGLKIDASFSADKVIDLLLNGQYYDDVTFAWTTDNETNAAIADGKLTLVVPDKEATVKITVTATCGDVTKTKEFTVKLSKSITPIKDLNTLGAAQESYTEEKYLAGGIITEIANDKYGNLYIKDENGDTLYIYGLYIDGKKYGDVEGAKPKVGDYIVVVASVGQYKGDPQMKNADLISFLTPSSIKDAVTAGTATESGVYSENNYLLSGEITEVQNEKYGNVVIKDAEGNTILLYGLYDQIGTRYDKFATKPGVGDTITVFGPTGNYKGAAQLKNATLVGFTAKAAEGGDNTGDNTGDETPAEGTKLTVTIADFAAANSWQDATPYTEFKLNADITVTASGTPVGEYGLNTGKYYASSNTWRIYQNEKPALTITAAEGKTIASVKITYSTKNEGILTNGDTQIASGTVVTVNANSITFSVANTGTKTNGQAQITAIEIVYN